MSLTPDRTDDLRLTRLADDTLRCERMRLVRDAYCEERVPEGAHQPRERDTTCTVCRTDETGNVHAVCVACHNADRGDARCDRCTDDPMHLVWPELAGLDVTSDRFPLGLAVSA